MIVMKVIYLTHLLKYSTSANRQKQDVERSLDILYNNFAVSEAVRCRNLQDTISWYTTNICE